MDSEGSGEDSGAASDHQVSESPEDREPIAIDSKVNVPPSLPPYDHPGLLCVCVLVAIWRE